MQVIVQAVMSLPKVYISRNLPADQLRKQNVLSLSQTPQLMLQPTLSGQLPCEFLSLEAMHRWILCELPCRFYMGFYRGEGVGLGVGVLYMTVHVAVGSNACSALTTICPF